MSEQNQGAFTEQHAELLRDDYYVLIIPESSAMEKSTVLRSLVEAVMDEVNGDVATTVLLETYDAVPESMGVGDDEKAAYAGGLSLLAVVATNKGRKEPHMEQFAARMEELMDEDHVFASMFDKHVQPEPQKPGRHVAEPEDRPMPRKLVPGRRIAKQSLPAVVEKNQPVDKFVDDPNLGFEQRLHNLVEEFESRWLKWKGQFIFAIANKAGEFNEGESHRHDIDFTWVEKLAPKLDMLRKLIESDGLYTAEGIEFAKYTHDGKRWDSFQGNHDDLADALKTGRFLTRHGQVLAGYEHDRVLMKSRVDAKLLEKDIQDNRFLTQLGKSLASATYDEYLLENSRKNPELLRKLLEQGAFLSNMGRQEARKLTDTAAA